jgi:serine/threonine-protein kinase
MGDGEKSLPSLEATILVKGAAEAEARVAADTLEGSCLKHFQVVRLLGRGGMGAVYYGNDTSLERPVAIKILAPELAHDPEVVARFEREARAQARLRHPNVAQIYFIGEDRGVHFFVMEHLEGPGLDSLLARPEPLPWAQALEYTIAAARGLRAASAQGFVHRDVKPSNLMLDREAGIKILDFGLVKSMHGDSEPSSARHCTCRPNRDAAAPSIFVRTSTRWAARSITCCAAGRPSPAPRRWA